MPRAIPALSTWAFLLSGCGHATELPSDHDTAALTSSDAVSTGVQGDATTTATGSGDPSVSTSGGESADSSTNETGDPIRYDVGMDPGATDGTEPGPCADAYGPGSGLEFIWIAHRRATAEPWAWLSKFNIRDGTEVARYNLGAEFYARPWGRASINQLGDAVINARVGTTEQVVKIAAREDRCVERDGQPGIHTSTGPDDVVDLDQDECRLWTVPIPEASGFPLALAWEGSEIDPMTCLPTDAHPRLWVGYGPHVVRLDGDTGQVLDQVDVPEFSPLWGAVDRAGNLWMTGETTPELVRIDSETLDVTRRMTPQTVASLAVDRQGDPWLAGSDHGLFRFDVASSTFSEITAVQTGHYGSLSFDFSGRLWMLDPRDPSCHLTTWNGSSAATIALPIDANCVSPFGLSLDADNFLWIIDDGGGLRINPHTRGIDLSIDGLWNNTTPAGMTGVGLAVVIGPAG